MAYSSCALCWLSDVPPELSDTTSPAYNGGRIHYTGASAEVAQAYSRQYKKDVKSFLVARSRELAEDGLMALIVPGVPDGFLRFSGFNGIRVRSRGLMPHGHGQRGTWWLVFLNNAYTSKMTLKHFTAGTNQGGGCRQFQPAYLLHNSKGTGRDHQKRRGAQNREDGDTGWCGRTRHHA